jgi:hypothetical protein
MLIKKKYRTMTESEHRPVLAGIGMATSRREENFEDALEPIDLIRVAVSKAGQGRD